MSTWATDAFGNDYAMDWAQDLQEYKTLELVETTLDNVIDSTEAELEAPFAAEALAALEVIARLLGKPGQDDPATAEVDEWVAACKKKVTPPLLEKATLAFERITAEASELRQLWQESEHFADWQADVADLRQRVLGKI
ncbi:MULTISPECIES: DUF4259 domain-containing protein [unclassified Janthinobacterium]|jgi:vacuolar-type H+-ATPase subunit I/STV1|uniref:DUF4259 domain-containing protein n=1 Tax=unclassified Janthinobacterium TaxID=2610881 RepID=UPI00160A29B1|nr:MULTISPECIES: DUF4259 domain-containing protein [unclassified Janthinobacterium]MBB5607628.1 vacuolar-type H+-ATPase subunit I/STV1 [Janthinobacterium sp. S3T4]MBB5612650.1 vacuolar-type H+-ATPase subunit I/STV1 [Janthinobacterium sp. S3M3]